MTIIVADGKTPVAAGAKEMKPLVGYFKNLKAGLDAYSERQLNEMDKYQTERLFDEAIAAYRPANLDLNLGAPCRCSFQLCQPSATMDISAA